MERYQVTDEIDLGVIRAGESKHIEESYSWPLMWNGQEIYDAFMSLEYELKWHDA